MPYNHSMGTNILSCFISLSIRLNENKGNLGFVKTIYMWARRLCHKGNDWVITLGTFWTIITMFWGFLMWSLHKRLKIRYDCYLNDSNEVILIHSSMQRRKIISPIWSNQKPVWWQRVANFIARFSPTLLTCFLLTQSMYMRTTCGHKGHFLMPVWDWCQTSVCVWTSISDLQNKYGSTYITKCNRKH